MKPCRVRTSPWEQETLDDPTTGDLARESTVRPVPATLRVGPRRGSRAHAAPSRARTRALPGPTGAHLALSLRQAGPPTGIGAPRGDPCVRTEAAHRARPRRERDGLLVATAAPDARSAGALRARTEVALLGQARDAAPRIAVDRARTGRLGRDRIGSPLPGVERRPLLRFPRTFWPATWTRSLGGGCALSARTTLMGWLATS